MLTSCEWLKDFIDTGMTPEETAHALTMAGLEIEGIEAHGEDRVLEVNVTPNRPDCLSLLGIARDLRAITGKELTFPEHEIPDESPTDFTIEIDDPSFCARYAGRIVRGVKVAPSPDWMQQRLERVGVRSVNNIVDITNYVLMELGHPLHAFDLSTLRGKKIRVAVAGKDQRISTLDGSDRSLPEDALLIWDGERPVAIAGVMGGLDTEVSDHTSDILIESAYFKPQSVRRTARELGMSTEASFRFERGTDLLMLEKALDRTALLVSKIAGGTIEKIIDTYPSKFNPISVAVKFEKVNRLLGTTLSSDEMLDFIRRLAFEFSDVTSEGFTVTPPSYRPDIMMEADIIEEIARLYGYENIPTTVPSASISAFGHGRNPELLAIKLALRKEGFNEAINYSFMNEKYISILGIADGDRRRKSVCIQNPLRAEDALLRTTLAPALMENFLHNFNRGVREIRIFELAQVFEDVGKELPDEHLRLGAVLYVGDKHTLWKETAPEFFALKGALESVLSALRVADSRLVKPSTEPFLHPGKSADLFIGNARAGYIGELAPQVVEKLDLKTTVSVNIFELDMILLLQTLRGSMAYMPFARYPAVERDLAVVLDASKPAKDVESIIRAYLTDLIEDVTIFDEYRGKGIAEGKKSLGFSIRYRSAERTLTDEEVDVLHSDIVKHIEKKTGGQLRG